MPLTSANCFGGSPDGKTLVTGDESFRIDDWDLASGQVKRGAASHPHGDDRPGVLRLAWR
jgi:hypothetical protein